MLIKYIKLTGFKRMPLSDLEVFEHSFTSKMSIILGPNGSGKAQPLSSYIKVPNGWELMGNMKVGTDIIARDGTIAKVNGVFPQGKKEIYKLTFEDGRTTRATADHLWKVYVSDNISITSKVVTTLDLINILKLSKTLIWIDLPIPEQIEDINLPIDPYTLGIILSINNSSISTALTYLDNFIVDKIKNNLPHNIPYEKIIPKEYFHSSVKQRLELLQGLMDINGNVEKDGTLSCYVYNYKLATHIQYLIRSLGGIASIYSKNLQHTNYSNTHKKLYQVTIKYNKANDLFTLPKKKKILTANNQYQTTLKLALYSIEVDGFEETQCISIDHPDKLYITDNFIVTHNSSLLNELTPLPSSKDNFTKKGYKEIHIEHNNNQYKLISDFRDTPKYSFIFNDEELNISNNITTQKELVYKHFSITDTIHNLLTGYDNFTDMSLLSRKKLFNAITNLNIDTILNNYNTLKEELKNNEYMLKTYLTLYQQEESKLLNESKFKELETKKQYIKDYIDILFNIRTELSRYTTDLTLDTAYTYYKDIQLRIKSILDKYYIPITSYPYHSIQDNITHYSNKKEVIQYKLKELYTLLEEKQKQVKLIELNKVNNIESLSNTLLNILKEIEVLTTSLKIFKNTINNDKLESSLYTLEISLPDIVRNIPLNTDKLYTKEKYEKLLSDKNTLLQDITTLITNETSIVKDIKHIEEHKNNKVKCPKCEYEWSPNYNEETLSILNKKLQEILTSKLNKQKAIEDIDKDIKNIIDYFNIYKQYSNIRNNTYSVLKELWDIIDTNEYIFNNPTYILQLVKEANMDIVNLTRINELNKILKTTKESIANLESIKDTNLLHIEKDILDITNEIYLLQENKESIDNILNDINIVSKVYSVITKLYSSLNEAKLNVYNSNLSYSINKIIEHIDNELSKNKVTFIELEKEISSYNNIKNILSKYSKDIEDVKENIRILNIILDELSPKSGLIAKTISNFLNVIISGMNSVISSIWDYKMNLKVIDIDEDILNYKFKVEVEDKIVIEDISKISAGMKEIVNLSFRLMLYKLLKLDGYSLYLDEFGNRLDKVHRSNISNLIFKLLGNNIYSQIFLVTHLDLSYSIFKDTEILELG